MLRKRNTQKTFELWWWSNLFTRESFPMDVFTKDHTFPIIAFLRLGSLSEWSLLENNLNDLFLNPLKDNTSVVAFCHLCCSLHGRYNRGAVSYVSWWSWADEFLPPNERESSCVPPSREVTRWRYLLVYWQSFSIHLWCLSKDVKYTLLVFQSLSLIIAVYIL